MRDDKAIACAMPSLRGGALMRDDVAIACAMPSLRATPESEATAFGQRVVPRPCRGTPSCGTQEPLAEQGNSSRQPELLMSSQGLAEGFQPSSSFS